MKYFLFVLVFFSLSPVLSNSKDLQKPDLEAELNKRRKLSSKQVFQYHGIETAYEHENLQLTSRLHYGDCWDADMNGTIGVVGFGSSIHILDVSNPENPVRRSEISLPMRGNELEIDNDYLYVANNDSGFRVVDISDPTLPVEVWYNDALGAVREIIISGNYAYLTSDPDIWDDSDAEGIRIFDISDPSLPTQVGYCPVTIDLNYNDIVASSDYVYLANNTGIQIIDVSDPAVPVIISSHDTPGKAWKLDVQASYLYVADYDHFRILDVSDPLSPYQVGALEMPADRVKVAGSYAYVLNIQNIILRVINVSNPSEPHIVGDIKVGDEWARELALTNEHVYIATKDNGLRIVNIESPNSPQPVGIFETRGEIKGVYLSQNTAYLAHGEGGLFVFDISDPAIPVEIGQCDIPQAYDVIVSGNYAYVSDYDYGLRIVDVSNPSSPFLVGSRLLDFSESREYCEKIFIAGNYVYMACHDAGLHIIDVTDPTQPIVASSYQTTTEIWDVEVSGSFAYLAAGEDGLCVLDINDPALPAEVGTFSFSWRHAQSIAVQGDYAYMSAGWRGIYVLDISEPSNVQAVGIYETWESTYEIMVSENYAYLGDGSGLRIIDITDPLALSRTALYETERTVKDLYVSNTLVSIASEEIDFQLINTSNPERPNLVGSYDTTISGNENDIVIVEPYAFVASGSAGMYVLDLTSSPAQKVGIFEEADNAESVFIQDNLAYVADIYDGLYIIDISDPSLPKKIALYNTTGLTRDVCVAGDYAYVADDNQFLILDVSDPFNPVKITSIPGQSPLSHVVVSGSYAYILEDFTIYVLDISNPFSPVRKGSFSLPGYSVYSLSVSGNHLYAASGDNGLAVIDISDPDILKSAGYYKQWSYARDCVIFGNHAYVGCSKGVIVADISNPDSLWEVRRYPLFTSGYSTVITAASNNFMTMAYGPVYVFENNFNLDLIESSSYHSSTPVTISSYRSFAYVGLSQGKIQILDLTDISNPEQIGYCGTPGSVKNIVALNHVLYIADHNGGIRVISVSDPQRPQEIWTYPCYAQDVHVYGNSAFVAAFDGLIVLDITYPSKPRKISQIDTPNRAVHLHVSNDHTYIVNESGDIRIVDVSDPANPIDKGIYTTPGNSQNISIHRNYAYIANDDNGLLILDISDPAVPLDAGTYTIAGKNFVVRDVDMFRNYAYIANDEYNESSQYTGAIRSLDMNDPLNLTEAGYYYDPSATRVLDLHASGKYVYSVWEGRMDFYENTLITFLEPQLDWTLERGYLSDGVDPDTGYIDSEFEFRVMYTDFDNEAPLNGYPKVHILKGGSEITDSPFTMTTAESIPFQYGRRYTYSTTELPAGEDYQYYFEAYDSQNSPARGVPKTLQSGPIVKDNSGTLGDVNGDESVNSTDALIALSCDVGLDVSMFCPMNCGDVNEDGLVNSTDALIILSYDVGLTIPFDVGTSGCPADVAACAGCN